MINEMTCLQMTDDDDDNDSIYLQWAFTYLMINLLDIYTMTMVMTIWW
jgi:hypothetical protein